MFVSGQNRPEPTSNRSPTQRRAERLEVQDRPEMGQGPRQTRWRLLRPWTRRAASGLANQLDELAPGRLEERVVLVLRRPSGLSLARSVGRVRGRGLAVGGVRGEDELLARRSGRRPRRGAVPARRFNGLCPCP